MDNDALVTIVVPVYNGETYVKHCVEQIKGQTYKNLEVIFVNDGSTDDSAQVIQEAIKEDDRFNLINKENGGTSTTRNKGIDNAHGEYIAFFDCDDEYEPDMIREMVFAIEENDADLVSVGYYFKIETNNGETYLEEKKYPFRFFKSFDDMKAEYVALWDKDMFYNVWNKLYRMSIINQYHIRYRVGHVYTEDRVFNRSFLSCCNGVVILDKCLYYYVRERAGSTSERYWDKNFDVRLKEYNELKEHFRDRQLWNKESREYVSREFIERVAGCIENVFHAGNSIGVGNKYRLIRDMIHHTDVKEASKYAKCKSKKMRFIAMPIKFGLTPLAYAMGYGIYAIRRSNPVLFHKLKGKR